MYGWIVYNAFLESDKFIDFAQMLENAALKENHTVELKTNAMLHFIINSNQTITNKPDYVLFTDKDIYLAKSLEMSGIRVFNSSEAIEISDDKIKTYQMLAKANIKFPKTFILPKSFGKPVTDSPELMDFIMAEFSFPLIIKEAFGSFGEQVYLIENKKSLINKLDIISHKPAMVQAFIESSFGVDFRLQIVGEKVVAAMKRTSENDFRANITSGGKSIVYHPSPIEKEMAIRASNAIGADFSGVDLLIDENDEPIVCEVNSNAHIRNLFDCTGINTAEYIIQYIEKSLIKKNQNV